VELDPIKHMVPRTHLTHHPDGISMESAIFPEYMLITNRQTNEQQNSTGKTRRLQYTVTRPTNNVQHQKSTLTEMIKSNTHTHQHNHDKNHP